MAQETISSGEGVIKAFQLKDTSISKKSDDAYGKALAEYILSTIGGTTGYYWLRNSRFRANRNLANGVVNMAKYKDLLEFNGKINYLNLNWKVISLVNRIVSGIVGRWMNRREKIGVTATDSLSVKQKREEYEHLEFIIANRKMLEELQAKSGVQMIPEDMIPQTKDELDLWQTQNQRLPEEILFELGCNDTLEANGFFTSSKSQLLWDSAVCGFVGTFTEMDESGVITVEEVLPENALYSYSSYDDLRDTTWRGRIKSMKVSELRRKYGKEFGGKFTEQQIFEIASNSKDYQVQDKLTWIDQWTGSFFRPYDEMNIDVIDFEFKTVDSEAITYVNTKKNKSTFVKKEGLDKKGANEEVIEDTNWNIYRGVYAKDSGVMLEWGLKKNMIRPQDPKEIGNAEFSYSFFMYQSFNMRNIAIPEKIEAAVDQMILVLLRMQQVIAKMRPTGAAINWDALQEIDYGLGDQNRTIDPKALYDQTGDIYHRGKDSEGNPIPVPIVELQNTGFIGQMEGLIKQYQFQYQVLKDVLGEDPNLVSSAIQPRVTSENVNTSQDVAANATDYMYDAYKEVMAQTATKISCLLKNSVTYGSKAYRKLLKEEDVEDRIFGTKIQMLPTDQEIAMLDNKMNIALAANPDLVMYLDTFKVIRIAKENVKLAEEYFRLAMKKMKETQQQQAIENQKLTFEGQVKSAQAAEEAKQKTEELKGSIDLQKAKIDGDTSAKATVITMIGSLYSSGMPIPPEIKPLADAVINNIMLPLVLQTEEQKQAIAQQMQEQQQGGAQEEMPPQEQQEVQAEQQQEIEQPQ